MFFSELLAIIAALASCMTLCFVIVILLMVFCRKDPLCCKQRLLRTTTGNAENHIYSRPSVIGISLSEHDSSSNQTAAGPQSAVPGGLFIVGRPNDYQLDRHLPQLPSYESVRRIDRQRHIHSAVAQHFDLSRSHDEPPPAYEETFERSFSAADVQHLDVHLSVHTLHDCPHLREEARSDWRPCTTSRAAAPRPPLSL